jgi:dCTP deaminase
MGRLFVTSHITAGYGDVGFCSSWTLELKNMHESNAIKLYAGMRIGQVEFTMTTRPAAEYAGAYTNQHHGPQAPRLGKERF